MLANLGAYVGSDRQLLTPFGQIVTLTGVYDIPAAHVTIDAVLSNTSPTAPYRGAGRPEASYLIERIIEVAARELRIDPIELRRRNLIQSTAMPYRTPLGPFYDCGDFASNMELALQHSDYAGFEARRDASDGRRQTARYRARQCDRAGGGPSPGICRGSLPAERQRHAADGHQDARSGPRNVVQADPAREARHRSARRFSSSTATPIASPSAWARTARVQWWSAASALALAADKDHREGQADRRALMEVGAADISFADGKFSVAGTDRQLTLKQVAMASFQPARSAEGTAARADRERDLRTGETDLSERLPCLRSRDRPRNRRGRTARLSRGRRRRHGDQSARRWPARFMAASRRASVRS